MTITELMNINKFSKHLLRERMLTTTLKKVMNEFEEIEHKQEILDNEDTVSFLFYQDNKPDNEIMFYVDGALAVKIEDTF